MPAEAPARSDGLIIGAGPTGLALAVALRRHGAAVRLIDKGAQPSRHSKALVVQARTLELFAELGVVDAALARGERAAALNMYVDGRPRFRLDFVELESPYPFAFTLSQAESEAILAERFAALGGTVERRVALQGFVENEVGVDATLRHADGDIEHCQARWLVGCDGAHSTVRHLLGLSFEGARYDESFMLADVRVDWSLPAKEGFGFIQSQRFLAALPMTDGNYRLIAMRAADGDDARAAHEPTLAEFQRLVDELVPVPVRISDPVWLADFRLHRRMVPQFRKGRVLLAGDAAHIHSPAGGQGMNTGIQDAMNLAWKLALVIAGKAAPALLDSYQAERHPVAAAVLRATNLLFKTVALRSPLLIGLRSLLLPWLSRRPAFQRRFSQFISELAIGYRDSPIVAEATGGAGRFSSGPRPGDRAPDAALIDENGRATSLFAATRGPFHRLLLFDGGGDPPIAIASAMARMLADGPPTELFAIARATAATMPGATILHDASGDAHRRYGADRPCLYLIRPDGHVALRSTAPSTEAVVAFFRAAYGR